VSLLIIEFLCAVFWDVLMSSLEGRYQLQLNVCTEAEYYLADCSSAVNRKTAICNNRKCHQTISSFNCKTLVSLCIMPLTVLTMHHRITSYICKLTASTHHSGRAVSGTNCLLSLEHLDHGFQSHSRHGCLIIFFLCLCCPVQFSALRRTDPPSK
jgi:hypothetical protein